MSDVGAARSRRPLIELRGVTKDYRALRPLRIEHFALDEAQSVALIGFDQAMAEVFVDLIMGTTVPDTGEVCIAGLPTAAIASGDEWLRLLDQFGLLSERAVLVESFTAEQNLALPFSLEIDHLPDGVRRQVRELAEEVRLPPDELQRPTAALGPLARLRVRLGRALALQPRVLLAEHPNASLSAGEARLFAAELLQILSARRTAAVIVTADRAFAAAAAGQVLMLQPRTGRLTPPPVWRRWLR